MPYANLSNNNNGSSKIITNIIIVFNITINYSLNFNHDIKEKDFMFGIKYFEY